MRIVSWNCCKAFRQKYDYMLRIAPDIMVILESEHFRQFDSRLLNAYPNRLWYGHNQNQGVLILSRAGFAISSMPEHCAEYEHIIPIEVCGAFCLFAVWAQKSAGLSYSQQVLAALSKYPSLLSQKCILAGDFNSNAIWDKTQKSSVHGRIVEYLAQYQIYSAYHSQCHERMGEESQYTFSLYRNIERLYHINYCFASQELLNELTLQIPPAEEWISYSDHAPLIIDLEAAHLNG